MLICVLEIDVSANERNKKKVLNATWNWLNMISIGLVVTAHFSTKFNTCSASTKMQLSYKTNVASLKYCCKLHEAQSEVHS